jgi:protein SCO1
MVYRRWFFVFVLLVFVATGEQSAWSRNAPGVIDVDEQLGSVIPADINLRDESGQTHTTGELLRGELPIVLVLAYYRCPQLCPLVLNGVAKGLHDAGFVMGNDYRLVTVSIDPEDTPTDARNRKSTLQAKWGAEIEKGARFLVGVANSSRTIADIVGFRYVFDETTFQYGHPAVVVILNPKGRIARYVYGPEPSGRDLRLALTEAGEGKIGGIVDRVLVTCYRFDPATRRYGPYIAGFFRIGALVILVVVAVILGMLWRLERARLAKRDES